MIIGAGMFALPYVVWHTGFFWSSVHFLLTAFIVTLAHLLYGGVLWQHPERHRLPGYVRHYVGEAAYHITFVTRVASYFGYLLAYGILAGVFLAYFLPTTPGMLVVIFFIVAAPFLFLTIRNIGGMNLLLTAALVFFILLLFLLLMPHFHIPKVSLFPDSSSWFYPYGIFLFAFSGASVIPEVVELFGRKNYRAFERTVLFSTVLTALIYIIFIAAVLSAGGPQISEDGLGALAGVVGENILRIGALIGLLAISTSYIALGVELRFTFQYDLGMSRKGAGILVAGVPVVLYFLGVTNFVMILGVVGAIGVGVEGVMIALLARRANRAPLFSVLLLSLLLTGGVVLELLRVLGVV
jgi:amino acid permease